MKLAIASIVFAVSLAAQAALSLPAGLESKAKTAFTYIEKAKAALSNGSSKTTQSWLGKAEALLKSVLTQAPAAPAQQQQPQPAQSAQNNAGSNPLSALENAGS